MSPWKLLEGEQGLIPSERWRLEGEAWAGAVWRLRRRIRSNVGDESSSDRWNIYSCEAFDKPRQIDVEVACAVYFFANLLPTIGPLLQAGAAEKSEYEYIRCDVFNLFCSVANLCLAMLMLYAISSRGPLGVATVCLVRRTQSSK